ncbi:outer membrane lipoprotein-sorting protein [Rhodoblastus sphagnicola]|nr:outer-membrane lipoprotein carrier protein LolA [Rhodoblastus sphagnicola]MBB4198662.1 outer membrane lipoprotein-sorting protein [Rhodoblastus sphagnicola]
MAILLCGLALSPVVEPVFAQASKTVEKKVVKPEVKVVKPEISAISDPEVAIQMADDYFNSSRVMTADFVQTGQDGRRAEGKLYVVKPGRMRFEYAQPATMEIIADGVSVAIRDRKLKTQELYFIEQTPLKFLLKNDLRLKKDVKITDVALTKDKTVISLEDSTTFGGTSTIRLSFDMKNFNLTQWAVKDPQGYETLVVLHNIDRATIPSPSLFHIPSEGLFSE